jgi:hypothetical protein
VSYRQPRYASSGNAGDAAARSGAVAGAADNSESPSRKAVRPVAAAIAQHPRLRRLNTTSVLGMARYSELAERL